MRGRAQEALQLLLLAQSRVYNAWVEFLWSRKSLSACQDDGAPVGAGDDLQKALEPVLGVVRGRSGPVPDVAA